MHSCVKLIVLMIRKIYGLLFETLAQCGEVPKPLMAPTQKA